MVQRKVPTKLNIQADHVKSDKRLSSLKLSFSQHQDGKTRGADMKKKMKKSRSIKLSDLEALQTSPPSRRSLSQPGKPPPLHFPTTAASPQKQKQQQQQPLVRTIDGSPNYMKPTSSSFAKKELFPVSHRNTQSSSDSKNLPRKFLSNSKANSVSSKKPAKTLTRTSSLKLARTLTRTPSFKPSRACPRKSTARAALCADMNAPERATCSSTLKDSKFPAYLMLNPGGTESEGTSVMKVCPYTYCSLNGHHHAPLLPLKSFMSSRRRLLKTQKIMKLEALSPRRLKVPCETKKDSDIIEQNVFDGKPAYDEAGTGDPIVTPLVQEIGMDFFIETYANEKDAKSTGTDKIGKMDFVKERDDQQDIKSRIEENGIAEGEDGVKQALPGVLDTPPKSGIDFEESFKKYFGDVAIEVYTKGSFLQEQNAEDVDEDHPPSWFHEEMSMGSYCSEASYDGEHMENAEMDDSDSKAIDMEWEEEQLCEFNHEEDIDSSIFTGEDTGSKVGSLSESSHDVSVTWLDGIVSSCYGDILAEEALQEANAEESTRLEEQSHGISSVLEGTSESTETQEIGYPPNGLNCDQSSSTEEQFGYLTNAEDNGGEQEKPVDDEISCVIKELDQEIVDNTKCHKKSETCKIDETSKDIYSSPENNDGGISEGNQVHLFDVPEENNMAVQDKELLEKDQGKANKFQSTSCKGGEEQNASKNWKWEIRRKRHVEDDDEEIRKFNPRQPNFLPLVPEPEAEKVDLKHQMMDERKDAEEWMLDCALRQVVTKLAPARKRKVALLVEAFETVMPMPKCENHMRNNSSFVHARRIQACS